MWNIIAFAFCAFKDNLLSFNQFDIAFSPLLMLFISCLLFPEWLRHARSVVSFAQIVGQKKFVALVTAHKHKNFVLWISLDLGTFCDLKNDHSMICLAFWQVLCLLSQVVLVSHSVISAQSSDIFLSLCQVVSLPQDLLQHFVLHYRSALPANWWYMCHANYRQEVPNEARW